VTSFGRAAALGLLALLSGWAQEDAGAVFRTEARLVVLHVTVVDRRGNLITNLPRSAFKTYEDGVEQQVRMFRREDVPVSMGLIIDNSGSMKEKRRKVEAAAIALVKASNRQDEVFIVNFNDEPFQDVPFTNSIKQMEGGLARIDSRGGTAMRDAISASLAYAKKKGKHDKKVLVVVTDGNDNMSEISMEKLIHDAQQQEVLIYTIGLLTEEARSEAKQAKRALDAITRATGGQAFYPKRIDEVSKIALQVAHDIRSQYIIAYTPANQALDGSYRQIRVTVNAPHRPRVRTRSGYYATEGVAGSAALPPARKR
jgi:Ca-activated chloride channel family protein